MRVAESVKVESKLRLNGKHSACGLRVGVAWALQSSSTTALFPCSLLSTMLQKMDKESRIQLRK